MIEIDPDYGTYCECNASTVRGHGKGNVAVSLTYRKTHHSEHVSKGESLSK